MYAMHVNACTSIRPIAPLLSSLPVRVHICVICTCAIYTHDSQSRPDQASSANGAYV